MTLTQKILKFPDKDKVILTTFTGDYTTADIEAQIQRYKTILSCHELQGKKIALLVPSIPSYLSLVLAINELGGTIIPLSWQFRKDDLTAVLQFLDPHIVFTIHEHNGFHFSSVIDTWATMCGKETQVFTSDNCNDWIGKTITGEIRPLEKESIDFICCSSGSTGIPKGLVINGESFDTSLRIIEELTELTPTDNLFCNAPPNSVFGISSILGGLHTGARVVFPDNFELPKMVKLMQDTSCNKVLSTPSIFKAIYAFVKQLNPNIAKSIELVGLTGEMMTDGMVNHFELMNSCKFVGMYGSSEIGGAMYCDLRQKVEFSMITGIDHKIVHNELLLKSPAAFSCYYQNPQLTSEAFDQEGWFYTGDLVQTNEHHKIEIIGRKKDLIKKGGQQVFPGEIENMLSMHNKVKQAVVVGAPHPVFGEQIVAFVVPEGDLHVEDLYPFCSERIAGYKIPDRIVIIPEVPTSQGKVDKVTLRNMLQ